MKVHDIDDENMNYVTIEKIENGFLIICPDTNGPIKKIHKHTLNGVTKFLEEIWETQYIEDKDRTLEKPLKKRKVIKKKL